MRFAILTGGGDCPGMNGFVRAVVRSAINLKPTTSVWGIIDGWQGLVDGNFKKLTKKDTAGLAQVGGTVLGTLRLPELKDNKEMQEAAVMNLHDNFIDYLMVIGGNGSLKAAKRICDLIDKKEIRTRILFTPGSIDNDVCNNFGFSVGFYSAIDKSRDMLGWIRDTASAHRKVYIINSMGAESGYLAFYAGIATGSEHIILPGQDVDFNRIATMINERKRDTRILVAEGYEKTVDDIRGILEEIFSKRNIRHEIRTVNMEYFQRGGTAAVKDVLLASWLGYNMVKNAYQKCSHGFYTAYYGGQKPAILTLEQACDDDYSTHLDMPDEYIDFANAME